MGRGLPGHGGEGKGGGQFCESMRHPISGKLRQLQRPPPLPAATRGEGDTSVGAESCIAGPGDEAEGPATAARGRETEMPAINLTSAPWNLLSEGLRRARRRDLRSGLRLSRKIMRECRLLRALIRTHGAAAPQPKRGADTCRSI